ncbi:5-formyltetrahydrofolate cyclo-ligase [Methylobacterium sp. M6A4_1b]
MASETSPPTGSDWPAIRQWRRAMRADLIAQRQRIESQDRTSWSDRITERLKALLAARTKPMIGFYWPFRGEYDARAFLSRLLEQGVRLALPVVVAKAEPLQFREWRPGIAMTRGVWDIPIPAEGDPVPPDILLAPLVGFDGCNYRLGYGGGYYDRTIAAMPAKPLCIGIGYSLSRLASIHPQAHDRPMDLIVTEADPD